MHAAILIGSTCFAFARCCWRPAASAPKPSCCCAMTPGQYVQRAIAGRPQQSAGDAAAAAEESVAAPWLWLPPCCGGRCREMSRCRCGCGCGFGCGCGRGCNCGCGRSCGCACGHGCHCACGCGCCCGSGCGCSGEVRACCRGCCGCPCGCPCGRPCSSLGTCIGRAVITRLGRECLLLLPCLLPEYSSLLLVGLRPCDTVRWR